MTEKINLIVIGPNPKMSYRNGGIAKYLEYQQSLKDFKEQICVDFIFFDFSYISFSSAISKMAGFLFLLFRITFMPSQGKVIHLHASLYDKSAMKNYILAKLFRAKGLKFLLQLHGGRMTKISTRKRKYWVTALSLASKIGVFPGPQYEELVLEGFEKKMIKLANFIPNIVSGVNNSISLEILFLGRIEVEKGIFILLKEFEMLRDDGVPARLTYAGSGSKQEELKSKVLNSKYKSSINILGYIRGIELDELLRLNNIFVLPSHHEGFPLSFLECSSRGMVPLITINNAIPYFFTKGKEYLPIDINSDGNLCNQLKKIWFDQGLRSSISKAVKKKVESDFTVQTYLPKLILIYNDL